MRVRTDVLIVGAGLAGLTTALHARGRQVTVITADPAGESFAASDLAQGGIAAAMAKDDAVSLHYEDTLRAGGSCVNRAAARTLCGQAPDAIASLEAMGVVFARDGERYALHTEAAHSRARVLHVGDASGAAIMRTVRAAVAAVPAIEVMHSVRVHNLLRGDDGIVGIAAQGPMGPMTIVANAVVIASGGVGGLFQYSTNPLSACGDGIALALAAGARARDLEFVQFHPTALDVECQPLPLISEALRGAGAALIDQNGVPIVDHGRGALEPRDVVARAVYCAQRQGRRVMLDATSCDPNMFPSIRRSCRKHGFDLAREPIPITPAMHYCMGGIATDLHGRTSLRGLFAVGEAACTGVHGANRLASNSLLEAVVFGKRLGETLSREPSKRVRSRVEDAHELEQPEASRLRELRPILWRYLGIVRTRAGLLEGIDAVNALRDRFRDRSVLTQARLRLAHSMLSAALRRGVSCGAHFRSDDAEVVSMLHAG